jgi:hypothetical protein
MLSQRASCFWRNLPVWEDCLIKGVEPYLERSACNLAKENGDPANDDNTPQTWGLAR